MTKATDTELDSIHGGFAKWCLLILQGTPLLDKDGAAVLKPDGTPWLVPPSAAHMSTIRQYLKDNGVEALPGANKGIKAITDNLPFPAPDEDQTFVTH